MKKNVVAVPSSSSSSRSCSHKTPKKKRKKEIFLIDDDEDKNFVIDSLNSEERIVVHCKGGLGRAATIVCMILNWFNIPNRDSIDHIREVRSPDCVNPKQEEFLLEVEHPLR